MSQHSRRRPVESGGPARRFGPLTAESGIVLGLLGVIAAGSLLVNTVMPSQGRASNVNGTDQVRVTTVGDGGVQPGQVQPRVESEPMVQEENPIGGAVGDELPPVSPVEEQPQKEKKKPKKDKQEEQPAPQAPDTGKQPSGEQPTQNDQTSETPDEIEQDTNENQGGSDCKVLPGIVCPTTEEPADEPQTVDQTQPKPATEQTSGNQAPPGPGDQSGMNQPPPG